MKPLHPAKLLFKQMFDEAAKDPGPVLPTYFVGRAEFAARCRKAGIEIPDNFVEQAEWEEAIGLTEFAHEIFKAYHKAHGSDFTPMEKGAWRLRQKMKKSTHRK